MPSTKAKPITTTEENPLLKRLNDDVKEWKDYYDPYGRKHQDFWKLWDNKRVKKQYHGESDSFDPMTHQMVEANVTNVYSARPKMAFLARNRYQETDTKILNGMWDRTWDNNKMDFYLPIMGREATITGNMVVFPCWEPNPDGSYMGIKHVPLGDVILDGAAPDQFSIRKAGYKRLARLDELKEATRYDPETESWVPRYKNLDKIKLLGSDGIDGDTEKKLKDMLKGSTLNKTGKEQQVAVVHMIYLDRIVEVANGKEIIYEEDNPYHRDSYEIQVQDQDDTGQKLFDENTVPEDALTPEDIQAGAQPIMKTITVPEIKPFIPIAMHGGYKDGALLLAKGDVEVYADTQEDLNDAINMNKDNVAANVRQVKVYDTNRVTDRKQVEEYSDARPGSVVGIAGGKDSIGNDELPDMSTAALAEQSRAKQSIRDAANIDEVVQGVSDQQGAADKTATEIDAQTAAASSGFKAKTQNLEAGFYTQLGECWIKFLQIFMPDEDQMVRVNGQNGVEFQLYKPSQYWGLYDVKPTLESNAQAKKQAEARMALAAHDRFAESPYWNRYELEKYVAEKAFDMDDDQLKLMMNPNPINMAMMGGAPAGDAMGGTPSPQQPAVPNA
jgi:hypothetical protein